MFNSRSKSSKSKTSNVEKVSASAAKLRLLKKLRCTLNFEKRAWAAGATHLAGVDEVGRGSLFGPVVAAAVILYKNDDPRHRIRGLRDSKLLPAERREELALLIRQHAIAWAVAAVDSARIDQINIYQASRLAMLHAVQQLAPAANYLLVDAVRLDCELPQQAIIHGDALSASIAAASILAKVERDRMISAWDPVFPMYGLASNKGYCTPPPPRGPARARPLAAAPPVVFAGVERTDSAGSFGIYAGPRSRRDFGDEEPWQRSQKARSQSRVTRLAASRSPRTKETGKPRLYRRIFRSYFAR